MELSLSDSQPCSSKWDESQSKCSGHCCSIDYQWKMSDSLSQVSLFHPTTHTLTHTHRDTTKYVAHSQIVNTFATLEMFIHKLKRIQSTARIVHSNCFASHFQFTVEVFCNGAFVEHTVSFIGQTLNLKAWWGVY